MSESILSVRKARVQFMNDIAKSGLEPENDEICKKYYDFKADVTKKALHILTDDIPRKILYFNELVNVNSAPGHLLHSRDLEPSILPIGGETNQHVVEDSDKGLENPFKRLKTSSASVIAENSGAEVVPLHTQVVEMKARVLRYALELIEMVGAVKLWIQLNVPRIEDGNNFGVAIQEETIQELSQVEDSAFNLCDGVKYHTARARLMSKVMKYPNVEDYAKSVREIDRKEWIHVKVALIGIRDGYSMLYDLLHKNWEKVVKPRHGEQSYMVM